MKALLFGTVGLALLGAQTVQVLAQDTGVPTSDPAASAVVGSPSTSPASGPATESPTSAVPTSSSPLLSSDPTPSQAAVDAAPADGSPVGAAADAAVPTDGQPVVAAWEGPIPPAYRSVAPVMSPEEVSAWLLAPRTVLDANPEGGGAMVRFVRSLLGADNRTVLALVDLVKMSDVRDAQVDAVAVGFSNAVLESESDAPEYAAYIQFAVAQSDSKELIAAFEKASGAEDDATAAINSPGSRSPGAPGSGSLAGTGTPGPSGPIGSVGQGVVQLAGTTNPTFSRSGLDFNETTNLLTGATGQVSNCTDDTSPVGCVSN